MLTDQREIDTLQTACHGVAHRLGHEGGHDAVACPGGIVARVVQIKAVARDEADPGGDDFICDAQLEDSDRIACRQLLTGSVEKRSERARGETVLMYRPGGLVGA